jgi:hypothetical protein
VLPRILVGDCGLGCTLRRVAHEDRSRLGDALNAGGGVYEVARDHPLPLGADGHGSLACQHSRSRPQACVEGGHRRGELEGSPHCSFGVVLLRCRSAPDGHDGGADELLHRSAVARDRRSGDVEVAREELARVLGVACLRRTREADGIYEEDRDDSAFGDRACGTKLIGCDIVAEGRAALTAEPRGGRIRSGARWARLKERGSTLGTEFRPAWNGSNGSA